MKVKVIFNDSVIEHDFDENLKLKAGKYNVAFEGIHTFLPLYRDYDGKEWKAMGDPILYYGRTMYVFCKAEQSGYRVFET